MDAFECTDAHSCVDVSSDVLFDEIGLASCGAARAGKNPPGFRVQILRFRASELQFGMWGLS